MSLYYSQYNRQAFLNQDDENHNLLHRFKLNRNISHSNRFRFEASLCNQNFAQSVRYFGANIDERGNIKYDVGVHLNNGVLSAQHDFTIVPSLYELKEVGDRRWSELNTEKYCKNASLTLKSSDEIYIMLEGNSFCKTEKCVDLEIGINFELIDKLMKLPEKVGHARLEIEWRMLTFRCDSSSDLSDKDIIFSREPVYFGDNPAANGVRCSIRLR